jgi:nucleoside 2-deoxyribosyltransferase
MKKVYCSGPLFCPEEVAAMDTIAAALEEAGYTTFLPHRDGVEAFTLNAVNSRFANLVIFRPVVRFLSRATFALDISEVLECDCFVFNMGGVVPDEGGVVETGVAFASGKPAVLYKGETSGACDLPLNPVIMGASYSFETVTDVRAIPAALDDLAERLCTPGTGVDASEDLPGFVLEVVNFGRKVRWVLDKIQFMKPDNMMAPPSDINHSRKGA